MLKARFLFTGFLVLLFVACSSDDYLEAYRQDFGLLQTAVDGTAQTFRRDDGELLNITAGTKAADRDTLMRIRALYVPISERTIELRGFAPVLTFSPHKMKTEDFRADPVRLTALWMSGGYINLCLDIPTSDNTAVHYFAMDELETAVQSDDSRLLRLRLYHDAGSDAPSWHRETYLSCSLSPYDGTLQTGKDSVEVCVSTDKGEKRIKLPF